MSESVAFERKTLSNGNPNPKYVDVLDEDAGIAGQKFTCISFLSPDSILEKRETFLFNKFVYKFFKFVDKIFKVVFKLLNILKKFEQPSFSKNK